MVEFTMVDYWRYHAKFPSNIVLNDINEEYQRQKTHQYHDKVFKEILGNKKEFVNFIKRYTDYGIAKLKEDKLEKYTPNFITSNFKAKELDIIYKIKGRDVFIIVEHQSTIDDKMAWRMTNYCVELIRALKKERKQNLGLYPLICPIVLYTGKKKWDAATSLTDIQEEYYGFEPLNYPRYNLIDINDYTKEELLEEDTAVSKAMLFEKLNTKEEMKRVLEILTKKELTEEENQYVQVILNYSNDVRKKLEQTEIAKYRQILNKEGSDNMTNFEKLLIELIDDEDKKYKAAKKDGEKSNLQKVISNMLKMKLNDKIIIDATKINENELEKIKQELKIC